MKVAMAPLQHYQPIADEKTLDNHFKRVEENLMELSNVLGSLYLSSLSAATTSTNTLGTSQFVPHHQQRPSNFVSHANASVFVIAFFVQMFMFVNCCC